MIMSTVYLTKEQVEFFKQHPEISRSAALRQALDEYIKSYKGGKEIIRGWRD